MTIAVVIPCYRVRSHILDVLNGIGPECSAIYVVDDGCPEDTASHVEAECSDPRVHVLRHGHNRGVGAATLTGWRAALAGGAEIIVKLDGDGQMDPDQLPRLVAPILRGSADYTKGNRFFHLDGLQSMPRLRLIGNSLLSFASKLSSGYWSVFDPTNGFTAIHAAVVRELPLDKIAPDWFFESDVLFRLGLIRGVVLDVPMPARYGSEESNLRVSSVVVRFGSGHLRNTLKRIFYTYYLRNFNIASLELALGALLVVAGAAWGAWAWIDGSFKGVPATSGAVMLAALPVLIGFQFVLAFFNFDLQNSPHDPIHVHLVSVPSCPPTTTNSL
jgi:dolichol-phosphate mannosyltransferase